MRLKDFGTLIAGLEAEAEELRRRCCAATPESVEGVLGDLADALSQIEAAKHALELARATEVGR